MTRSHETTTARIVPGLLAFALLACAPGSDVAESGAGGVGVATGAGADDTGSGASGSGGDLFQAGGGTSTSTGTGGESAPCAADGFVPGPEVCGNGIDDDGDGFIDDVCGCNPGDVQSCFLGAGSLCECKTGQQLCVVSGEFGAWGPCEGAAVSCNDQLDASCEICGNGTDDDCDGQVDEDCVVETTVDIDGDCVTAQCPPQAPYPVGCNIVMSGGDDRGCVASSPASSVVYFQEGDQCGAGHVTGTLSCSSVQGAPLGPATCAINKPTKYYPSDPSGCPDT